jgi:hypothetical protein
MEIGEVVREYDVEPFAPEREYEFTEPEAVPERIPEPVPAEVGDGVEGVVCLAGLESQRHGVVSQIVDRVV